MRHDDDMTQKNSTTQTATSNATKNKAADDSGQLESCPTVDTRTSALTSQLHAPSSAPPGLVSAQAQFGAPCTCYRYVDMDVSMVRQAIVSSQNELRDIAFVIYRFDMSTWEGAAARICQQRLTSINDTVLQIDDELQETLKLSAQTGEAS